MACKDCLNRREFLAKSAMGATAAAALAALEACGDGQIGPTAANPGGNGGTFTVKVADLPGLATLGTLVRVPNQTVAVLRTGPSSFAAFSTICTHEGCDTSISNNRFSCPCHDSLFANNGAVLRGPATRPLDSRAVTFDPATNSLTIAGGTSNGPPHPGDDDRA